MLSPCMRTLAAMPAKQTLYHARHYIGDAIKRHSCQRISTTTILPDSMVVHPVHIRRSTLLPLHSIRHTGRSHDVIGRGIGTRRCIHSSPIVRHAGIGRPEPGTGLKVHFKDAKGNLIKTVEANEGDDILAIAHEYDIDLEGACEGSVACSTCHVILPEEYYDLLPEPEDDENDMLDMAFGLTDTSRLGCQVKMTKELDGLTCTLPSATRNMFVDGHKPSH